MKPGTLALLVAGTAFAVSVAAAQTTPASTPAVQGAPHPPPNMTFADPPHKNLKVLPQDTSRADLIANMKFFAQSLGVRCTYCHVGTEGQPLSTYDFASDAKDHKKVARDMMRLAQHLNTDHLPAITGLPDAKVTCFTCHRGSTKPATAPAPGAPNTVPPPPGAAAPPAKNERGTG